MKRTKTFYYCDVCQKEINTDEEWFVVTRQPNLHEHHVCSAECLAGIEASPKPEPPKQPFAMMAFSSSYCLTGSYTPGISLFGRQIYANE